MRPDEVGVGPPEVELVLELPPLLGEGQRLSAQSPILLPQGQVVAFHVGRVDRPLPAIGSAQTLSPSEDIVLRTKNDASVDVHDPAALTVLLHLGIAQQGMGNTSRITRPSWHARGRRPLPEAEHLQEHGRVMAEGV